MEIDTGTTELLCSVRDGVALITLNRPEARNAMSDRLTPALRTQIKERGEDPAVGAILITGAGTAFCSGGDVKGMGGRGPRGQMSFEERLGDLRWRQAGLTGALVAVRKPTIAALPGAAAGAGLAIALACDIRIAARSAFVSTGYARVGLSGDYGIAWLLTRAVGSARARELMFTAERVDAERCERIGLVNRIVADDKLQDEVLRLRQVAGRGSARGAAQHEGQSRRRAAHRLRDRASPRGRATGPGLAHRGSQGGGAGLRGEAEAGVRRAIVRITNLAVRL